MPGYASANDYESDLLASYRKRGRLPTIQKRDVNRALSIYKVPKRIGMGVRIPRKKVGDTLTQQLLTRLVGHHPSDKLLMHFAARTAITKNLASRRTAAKAKARIRRRRRNG